MCPHSSSTLFTPDRAKLTSCIVCKLCLATLGNGQSFLQSQLFMPQVPNSSTQSYCSGEVYKTVPAKCPMQSCPVVLQVRWESRHKFRDQQVSLWRWPGEWLGMQSLCFFLNNTIYSALGTNKVRRESKQRLQMSTEARRSFTVTDMLRHLLLILWVNLHKSLFLVLKVLPVLSLFLANWECSCCINFCFPIIQYTKNSIYSVYL